MSALYCDVAHPQALLPTKVCAMMWKALLPKTQSALLGSRKTAPSDKVTGNTFPTATPPPCFTCCIVNVICNAVVARDPSFQHRCPVQGTWLTWDGRANPFTVPHLQL